MKNLTKKQKKHLRSLGAKAYETDLGRCIDKLFEKYTHWKNKEISVWDMNQYIHEYHDEISRNLYKSYTIDDPIFQVAFGIQTGAIKLEDVEESCLDEVKRILKYFEER